MFVEGEIEDQEPLTWQSALEGSFSNQWREAMDSEMKSLEKKNLEFS